MCAQSEKASSKIKLGKWEAYLNWQIEAFKECTDKFSSLQEDNKKFLETVSELKRASKAMQCQHHSFPPSPTAPIHLLLLKLPYLGLPSPPPSPSLSSAPLPPLFPTELGETQNREPDQGRPEGKKNEKKF